MPSRCKSPSFTSLIAFAVFLLILYLLVPGPCYRYGMNTPVQEELGVVFAPIWWVSERQPNVVKFYIWYFDLWHVPPVEEPY